MLLRDLEEVTDEVKLIASIISSLGKSDKGMTPDRCENIAERLKKLASAVDSLRRKEGGGVGVGPSLLESDGVDSAAAAASTKHDESHQLPKPKDVAPAMMSSSALAAVAPTPSSGGPPSRRGITASSVTGTGAAASLRPSTTAANTMPHATPSKGMIIMSERGATPVKQTHTRTVLSALSAAPPPPPLNVEELQRRISGEARPHHGFLPSSTGSSPSASHHHQQNTPGGGGGGKRGASSSSARQQVALLSSSPGGAGAGGQGGLSSPRGGAHRANKSAAASSGVYRIPRAPPCENPKKEAQTIMGATLYNVLEALVLHLQCQSARIMVKVREELVSVCNVAAKLAFPPTLVRFIGEGTPEGDVLASGIAFHRQQLEEADRGPSNSLIFPVRDPRVPANDSSSTAGVIAVLTLENKLGGKVRFTPYDENVANICARMVGQVMVRYAGTASSPSSPRSSTITMESNTAMTSGEWWLGAFYDPTSLHVLSPFRPTHGPEALLQSEVTASVEESLNRGSGGGVGGGPRVSNFVADQLIVRQSVPAALDRHRVKSDRAIGIGAAPSMREIDSYVSNLHECWRASVDQNVLQRSQAVARAHELKSLREEVARQRTRADVAAEELRLNSLEASDYQREYTTLRSELEGYIQRRSGGLDEHFQQHQEQQEEQDDEYGNNGSGTHGHASARSSLSRGNDEAAHANRGRRPRT